MGKAFDYLVFPLLIPFILLWLLAARALSMLAPFLIFPALMLKSRLYWCLPFTPCIWKEYGLVGRFMEVGFLGSYTMNVVRRLLTWPIRRATPEFYIVGFPKCGTTSLANHLKRHPAISGLDGMPWHDVLGKESHYFNGIFGRTHAASRGLYSTFFPTVLTRWWAERVRGVEKWMCFDACPVPACLDYSAARMAAVSPNAKLIFMLRDPVGGAFSAEIMFRNLGMPIDWSFMEEVVPSDPRFTDSADDARYWAKVAALGPNEPLPEDLMRRFYFQCSSLLRCGKYADRVAPWLKHFPRENMMFIEFGEFVNNTEAVLRQVFDFVGADAERFTYKELPAGMQGERKGRRMHPSVQRRLESYFLEHNMRLYALLGRDFHWADPEAGRAGSEGEGDLEEGTVEPKAAAASSYAVDLIAAAGSGAAERLGPVSRDISLTA